MNMVRSISKGNHLTNELCGKAVATCILNSCPTKKVKEITLEECWSSAKPSLNHLKVFGFITHRHVLDELRRKLDDKLNQMMLIGYHLTDGYELFNPLN